MKFSRPYVLVRKKNSHLTKGESYATFSFSSFSCSSADVLPSLVRARQKNIGRCYRRAIHLFYSARELVEAHARCDVAVDEGLEQNPGDVDLNQSYLVLVQYLPIVVSLENSPEALEVLLTNVSDRICHCLFFIDMHANPVD